jgi:molecular chaperone DnaK
VLLDVLPLSLGLETRGGLFVKLIARNSTIPLKNTMTFTTVVDNQQSVEIHILQGEREICSGNRSLGKFELVGIPPAPRGVPQIEVMFEIDANGIVNVSARDKMTGLEHAMQITPSSGLAPDEIDRLIMEADIAIEQDKAAKEMIMLRNKLESLVKNTRKAMDELGKSLPLEEQQSINEILNKAEEAVDADSLEFIEPALQQAEDAANLLTNSLMTVVV